MTRILDTTLDRGMRARLELAGHSVRIHRACGPGYVLPASGSAAVRIDYRMHRRDGQPINEARGKALLYLDGFVAGWRARGHADTDYRDQPGSDAWYARQDVTA